MHLWWLVLQEEIQYAVVLRIIDPVKILQNDQKVVLERRGDLVEKNHENPFDLGLAIVKQVQRALAQIRKGVAQSFDKVVEKDFWVVVGGVQLVPDEGQRCLMGKRG
jgi:hypothetical protein